MHQRFSHQIKVNLLRNLRLFLRERISNCTNMANLNLDYRIITTTMQLPLEVVTRMMILMAQMRD